MIQYFESETGYAWLLSPESTMVQVGIVPTDTYPAIVCDIENKDAVRTLYELKGASPTKKLSILVGSMSDISMYTMGFPVEPNFYKIAKRILPGPYTLVLPASKMLPKQITNFDSGKSKKRATVGYGTLATESPCPFWNNYHGLCCVHPPR